LRITFSIPFTYATFYDYMRFYSAKTTLSPGTLHTLAYTPCLVLISLLQGLIFMCALRTEGKFSGVPFAEPRAAVVVTGASISVLGVCAYAGKPRPHFQRLPVDDHLAQFQINHCGLIRVSHLPGIELRTLMSHDGQQLYES
jgi:hypothetical protein